MQVGNCGVTRAQITNETGHDFETNIFCGRKVPLPLHGKAYLFERSRCAIILRFRFQQLVACASSSMPCLDSRTSSRASTHSGLDIV